MSRKASHCHDSSPPGIRCSSLPMIHKPMVGVLIGICALVLASCGSSSKVTNAGSNTSLASSWVTQNASGGAAFLTWTITGTHAVGSMTLTYLSSSGDSARHDSVPFSGTVSGDSVNINLNGSNISGTVTPGHLNLAFPQSNGQIDDLVLVPGTISTYNKEASPINSEANANEQAAQEAQQAQTAAAQNSQDRHAIRSASASVGSELSGIKPDESQLATDVTGTQQALASEDTALSKTQAYLATTQSMVKQYGTGSGNGVCYEASQDVGYEASQDVDYDATQNVDYDATQNILPDISTIQSAIQQLQSEFSSLQSAESAMPGYVPSGTPTNSQIKSAISTANADINNAVSTTNSYIAQANAYVATAYGYVDTAYSVGNCGSPPSLPTPVPPISASEASNY
jgi:hypothetical protein